LIGGSIVEVADFRWVWEGKPLDRERREILIG